MTRNGKIARLPLAVREELNQRLRNGQKGRQLVAWLNGLPEVRAVMAAEFNGEPMAEYNLSRWKNGGYRTWAEEQCTRETAAALIEECPTLQETGHSRLSDRVASILNARMVIETARLDICPEGRRKSDRFRDLLDGFVRLRRGNLEGERIRLASKRMALTMRQDKGRNPEADFGEPEDPPSA